MINGFNKYSTFDFIETMVLRKKCGLSKLVKVISGRVRRRVMVGGNKSCGMVLFFFKSVCQAYELYGMRAAGLKTIGARFNRWRRS